MRPVSIPEHLRHESEGFATVTIGPPPGTESSIGSVEAEVGNTKFGQTYFILMRITAGEMATLQENQGLFWYATMAEHLHPFSMIPVPSEDTTSLQGHTLEQNFFTNEEGTIFTPEDVAKSFHETYERLAPQFGYKTREASAKPWDEVPKNNRELMIAVVEDLFF